MLTRLLNKKLGQNCMLNEENTALVPKFLPYFWLSGMKRIKFLLDILQSIFLFETFHFLIYYLPWLNFYVYYNCFVPFSLFLRIRKEESLSHTNTVSCPQMWRSYFLSIFLIFFLLFSGFLRVQCMIELLSSSCLTYLK